MEQTNKAFVTSQVKSWNDETREVLHLITTPARDRMGDVVDSKGADLTHYRKNPVVLANHDYSIESVIGKAINLDVSKEGIYARTKFLDTPLANAAFELTKANLGGWSIGFRPTESHRIAAGKKDKCKICAEIFDSMAEGKEPGDYVEGVRGDHFTKWEMLEYSSVAIPANQEIVSNAVQRGLCPESLVDQFFRTTTEQETPPKGAADGPTVEPVHEYDPAIVRMAQENRARIDRILGRHHAAQHVADILGSLK